MNPADASRSGGRRTVRRVLALALLGSAVALVVVQLTKAMTHEVMVDIELAPRLAQGLDRLELHVTAADGEVPSVTVFRFRDRPDPHPRPVHHVLHLTSGRYRLHFRLHHPGRPPLEAKRSLAVTGDASVRYRLP